jgi:hypothetical protein
MAPNGQGKHLSAPLSLTGKNSGLQMQADSELDPSEDTVLSGQEMQTVEFVAPTISLYVLAGHGEHESRPV